MNARLIIRLFLVTFCLSLALQPFAAYAQQASYLWFPLVVPGTEDAPRCENGLIIDIDETVDASGSPDIEPSQEVTSTYALVVGAVADSWKGLPKVGTLRLGNKTWGSFVKNVPGTVGSRILGKLGAFAGLALIIEKICDTTSAQGIPAEAVAFEGGGGYIPMVEDIPAEGYITYFANASVQADRMDPGPLVAVVFSGASSSGWIVSSVPLVEGQKKYSMEVIDAAIPELIAEKKTGDQTTPTADAVDEWLQLENKSERDPLWIPDPDKSCPQLPASSFDYKARVLIASQMELQRVLHAPYSELSFAQKQELVDFVDWASYELPRTELFVRYKTPPPRSGEEPHDAHYTSHVHVGTSTGEDINIELRCWWVEDFQEYIWNFRRVGPLHTGLTASIGSRIDFVEEAYDYIN